MSYQNDAGKKCVLLFIFDTFVKFENLFLNICFVLWSVSPEKNNFKKSFYCT